MALCGGALAPGRALAAARSDDQAGSDVQGPMPAPGDAGVVPAAGPWTFEALVHAIVTTNPRIRAQVAAAGEAGGAWPLTRLRLSLSMPPPGSEPGPDVVG